MNTEIAIINESDELLLEEVADLLFHTIIALKFRNLSIFDALDVLKSREKK
jgi:phosphoribosyl-ATP pyrophosphohydrolase